MDVYAASHTPGRIPKNNFTFRLRFPLLDAVEADVDRATNYEVITPIRVPLYLSWAWIIAMVCVGEALTADGRVGVQYFEARGTQQLLVAGTVVLLIISLTGLV